MSHKAQQPILQPHRPARKSLLAMACVCILCMLALRAQAQNAKLTLNFHLEGENPHPATNTRLAEMTLTVDGSPRVMNIELKDLGVQRQYSISGTALVKLDISKAYRGYRFKEYKGISDPSNINPSSTVDVIFEAEATDSAQHLFYTNDEYGVPYRIPAIVTTRTGRLIAVCDRRYGGDDLGRGGGHIDLASRYSDDNGETWSDARVLCDGNGIRGDFKCAYSDPSIVADRESDEILLMSVTGDVSFTNSTRENPVRVQKTYSHDNGDTWDKPIDITESLYKMIPGSRGSFVASGRILQSRLVKKDRYYRIYCALASWPTTSSSYVNHVMYSDDFGQTWALLGKNLPTTSNANEAKLEELPNGDIAISVRATNSRIFNVYNFSNFANDQETGKWDTQYQGNTITYGKNGCNGEILMVPVISNSTGTAYNMLLQTAPYGDVRERVTFWYRTIPRTKQSANGLSKNWKRSLQVSPTYSAYSTMTLQADNRIGFLFEESYSSNTFAYDIVYIPLSIEQITGGSYRMMTDEEMSIDALKASEGLDDDTIYDLTGRRVEQPRKHGIYIQNGKKHLIQ